jgi:hypothetical protein
MIGSIGETIIPGLPAQAPLAFFAIGFGCVFGAALSDVKASQQAETAQVPVDVAKIVQETLLAMQQQTQPPSASPQAQPITSKAP